MDGLDLIAEQIRDAFERMDQAREVAYKRSRELIRVCATAIRAMHREEWDEAEALLAEAKRDAQQMVADVEAFPELYQAGYTQDALKEYVEAYLTYAIIHVRPIPGPDELAVEPSTWINGLAEAATELRRRILDITRHTHSDEAEYLLGVMDDVYSILVTFDFPDSITRGLRRRTDTVRAVLERTRGDVTTSLRQARLEEALSRAEERAG